MWEPDTDIHFGNSELKGLSERLRQIAGELRQLNDEHPKFSERLKHFQKELWAASQKLRSIH
jgi:DNA anti-recombination protein RmuC